MEFDEAYVSRLRQGDPEAEAHFADYFSRAATLMLRRYLRSPDQIQDACQETLLRALRYFRAGKTLEQPERLPGFVQKICGHVAMEMLRASARHPQTPAEYPEPPDPRADAASAADLEERRRIVREVLAELPAKDRDLMRLAVLEERDRVELCRQFNTNEDYLRVLVHRARLRFKEVYLRLNPGETPPLRKSQTTGGR